VGEVGLAIEQLDQAAGGDLIITDRGYTGYSYLSAVAYVGFGFDVHVCSTGSFAAASGIVSPGPGGAKCHHQSLWHRWSKGRICKTVDGGWMLTVRFISLRLPTGELEVLC